MVNWPENHHSGQNIDTSTPEGWLFFYMNAAFDQSQHKIIVENTQARLKSARKNGRIGSRPTLMTDKRIRVAQSMHKNPIGSFVPLWDLTQESKLHFYLIKNVESNFTDKNFLSDTGHCIR